MAASTTFSRSLPVPGGSDSLSDSIRLYPGRSPACVLVHGFTATAEEMAFLARQLSEKGRQAIAVQLPGHGSSAADLNRVAWRDWYDRLEQTLLAFATPAQPAIVVGQSLGALLAMWAALHRAERVAALVLLAPALVLQSRWLHWLRPALPLLARWRPLLRKGPSDIADPEARAARRGYDQIPVRALYELLCLQREVRKALPLLRQPILALQSAADHTCSWQGIELLKAAGAGRVEIVRLERSFHVVSVDCEKEIVAARVHEFVERYVASHHDPSAPGTDSGRSFLDAGSLS